MSDQSRLYFAGKKPIEGGRWPIFSKADHRMIATASSRAKARKLAVEMSKNPVTKAIYAA